MLASFPERAPARNDIRPGLHVTHYKGRAVIAYTVDENAAVSILGVYYGGRDYEDENRAKPLETAGFAYI